MHTPHLITLRSWTTYAICFNPNEPPLDNINLRRALAMVIDRDHLAQVLAAERTAPAHGGWIPHGLAGHSPEIGLPFDPAAAQHLMVEAGHPDGHGLPALEAIWPETPTNKEQSNYLADLWLELLGVTIEPVHLPVAEWIQRLYDGPPAIYFHGWTASPADPDYFLRGPIEGLVQRYGRLQEIVNAARKMADQKNRLELYRQVDKMLMEEALIIPLTYGLDHYFLSSRVRKFPATSRLTLRWRDIVVDPD